jgi:SSS family solute:Na+ symporter
VYATGSSFGIYEGFWGLLANVLTLVVLNPVFVKKSMLKTNPVIDQLFAKQQVSELKTRKGA